MWSAYESKGSQLPMPFQRYGLLGTRRVRLLHCETWNWYQLQDSIRMLLLGGEGLPYSKSGITAFKTQFLKGFNEARAVNLELRASRRDQVRVCSTLQSIYSF
jgi:hypothetical protein